MSDKKSCENCDKRTGCSCCELCKKWVRDADLWLSIPPTDPGIYWLIDMESPDHPRKTVVEIAEGGRPGMQVLFLGTEIYYKLEEVTGQWQGPITPREDK